MDKELRELLISRGAALVGVADLTGLPAEIRQNMPIGVSIAVALDQRIIAAIAQGPTLEYQAEYRRGNALLNDLACLGASYLGEKGYAAVPVLATQERLDLTTLATVLPHKTVATRAGLGWIGKSALLVTEQYGSAIRLGSILTDAPLVPGMQIDESKCGECRLCLDACPARAGNGRLWETSMSRADFFDAFACLRSIRERMPKVGLENTVCGICISVCPWTGRYLKGE